MSSMRWLALSAVCIATLTACSSDASGTVIVNPPPIATVATVTVTPNAATLTTGQTQQLGVTLQDAQGHVLTGRAVNYSSAAPTVATVSQSGLVSAVAAGQALVTVSSEGKTAAATITVSRTAVAVVEVAQAAVAIEAGASQTISAVARDAQQNVLPDRPVTWSSSAPNVATVDAQGKITAITVGSATLTATAEDKSAQVMVTVMQPAVATVELLPTTLTLDIGQSATLAVALKDARGNVLNGRAVTWSTAAPNIATVNATGRVTAVSGGTTRITATSEGKSTEAVVNVRTVVAAISIATALDTLEAYDVLNLQATTRDANGNVITTSPVTWTSSNPAIATVNFVVGTQVAMLTGVDRGTVTITATSGNATASVTRVVVIKYRSITAGTMHACDIASGGIAWCWGLNSDDARLGLDQVGTNVYRSEPFAVPGGHRFTQLVTYGRTTCGLRVDGRAYCWGNNGWGALGDGSNSSFSANPVAVQGGHTFTKLAAGSDHACGLATTGSMLCWGHNDWGQFGRGNTASSTIPLVAANGMVFTSIAAGANYTCGVAFDGNSYCFGASGLGQLGDGATLSYGNTFSSAPSKVVGNIAFSSLTLGNQFACGLTANGAAHCWGSNNGKLGNGNATTDVSSPKPVSGGYTFTMLSAGYGHACGVTTSADVFCWGGNAYGQLGSGVPSATSPVQVSGGLKASEVTAAGIGTGFAGHSCAISRDRLTSYCWGRNDVGQLGNGTTSGATAVNATPSIVKTQKPL